MALNVPQVLVGCCISNVCVLCIRKESDLLKLRGGSNQTIWLVKADDKETFERLGEFVTAKEILGEFVKIQLNNAGIVDIQQKKIVERHKELMKDRNHDKDFREGDIVIASGGSTVYKVKEITESRYLSYKKSGYMALDYAPYSSGEWIPWSYATSLQEFYRVE